MITFFSFQCAMIAYVYSCILTEGGMILNSWYKFLERHLGSKPWLFKPIIDCHKCVAGQISFWGYFIFYLDNYALFEHIYCCCGAIFLSKCLQWISNKTDL